jgi:hypothetical protein
LWATNGWVYAALWRSMAQHGTTRSKHLQRGVFQRVGALALAHDPEVDKK